jgi:hypothetical protein
MAGGIESVTMTDTAERLRLVRQAYERFLVMAAVDCIMDVTTRNLMTAEFDLSRDDTDREGADRASATGADSGGKFSSTVLCRLFRDGLLDD